MLKCRKKKIYWVWTAKKLFKMCQRLTHVLWFFSLFLSFYTRVDFCKDVSFRNKRIPIYSLYTNLFLYIYICLHDLGRKEKKWATGNLDKIESCLLSGWQVEWSEDISVRWRIIMTTILLDFWRSLRRDVTCPSVSTVATSTWTRYPRESAVTVSQTPPLPLHPHTQLTRVIKFVLTEYCRFVL